jgi:hypothetical protein
VQLGGFDEGFTIASCEDWELGMRARQHGVRILYDPGIVALHNDWAVDLGRFCERQFLYSVSDVRLWRMYGDASPRAAMVRQNAPVEFGQDSIGLVLKKISKQVLATRVGLAVLAGVTLLAEKVAPDGGITRRLYNAAIGVAIFRGVREGLKRY